MLRFCPAAQLRLFSIPSVLSTLALSGALALAAMGLLSGCDDDDDAEEVVSTFQPIGVSRAPVFAKPGTAGTIAFHFLAPKDFTETLTYENQVPEGLPEPLPLAVQEATLSPSGEFGATLSELTYYKVVSQYVLPSAEELGMSADNPYVRAPIQVSLTGGGTSRVLTTSLAVYIDGHPAHQEAEGRVLGLNLTEPTGTVGADQKVAAKGAVVNPMAMDKGSFVVGWFSSGGKLENTRAITTDWQSGKDAGPYNLVLTVRGNTSREFALAVTKVTVSP